MSTRGHRSFARPLLCSTALTGTVAIACILPGLGAGAAQAAEFLANDTTSLQAAIASVNTDTDATSTIRLTSDITLDPGVSLAPITRSVTIDIDGHNLRGQDNGVSGGDGHSVILNFPSDPGVTLTIEDNVSGAGSISASKGASGIDGSAGADGGNGGASGDGLHIDSIGSLEIAGGSVLGEVGGDGGHGGAGGNGGNGGAGGNGIWLGSGDLTNSGYISARTGGYAGSGVIGGDGGNGGNGVVLGAGNLTNDGHIVAGTGSSGGSGTSISGNGGAGGTGVSLGTGTLINNGTIGGGTGGSGGGGLGGTGYGGAGGAGVTVGDGQLTNIGEIIAGTGGNGGFSVSEDGGDAGAGGSGIDFSGGSLTSSGSVTGGDGGSGGDSDDENGGVGGGGGSGIDFSGGSLTSSGSVTGGIGGNGGASDSEVSGNAGNGGNGINFSGSSLTSSGSVKGGKGGDGGDGSGSHGGNAGSGGIGIDFSGDSLTNDGDIQGGTGGVGGYGNAVGGDGGAGAAGVLLNSGTLANTGTISGGNAGGDGSGADPLATSGGRGVVAGPDVTIVNSGTISGGLSNNFDPADRKRANAITFAGGANRLELHDGYSFTGNVDATGGTDDTFALGGDSDPADPFDVSKIVMTATAGAADEYVGFEHFEKTGASIWTLDGTGAQDWLIDNGTLIGDTDSFGGDLTFGSGAGARGVVFDQSSDGNYLGTISGDGSVTKSGTEMLELSAANTYTGGTDIIGGAIMVGATGALGTGPVTVGSGAGLAFINGSAGALALTSNGGEIDFSLYASAGTATITNNAGTVFFGGASTADDATITNNAGGSVDISNVDTGIGIGSLSGDGKVILGSKALTLGGLGLNDVIGGTISGDGTFSKTGDGTLRLTGNSSGFAGDVTISQGTLDITGQFESGLGTIDYTGSDPDATAAGRVSGSAASWTLGGHLFVGQAGTGALDITGGGTVASHQGIIGYSTESAGSMTVTGPDSIWTLDDALQVGREGAGELIIADGGTVSVDAPPVFNFRVIGSMQDSIGAVTVTGAGSTWNGNGPLYVGQEGNGALTVADGGVVSATQMTIATLADSVGTLNIGAADGDPATAAGTLDIDTASVVFGKGNGTLVFNHTDHPGGTALAFDAALSGDGTILHENGTTLLTGNSSGFNGATTVSGGKLLVNGVLGSAAATLSIGENGTLGGSGTIGGDVDVDGTLSAGNSPGTLTVDGDLALNGDSTSVFELNTPGVPGGVGASGNDLVEVGGDLSLGGALDARVAAAGYYRLFNYDGTLTGAFDSGTLTGTGGFTPLTPNSPDIRYDTAHQVNLSVIAAGQTMEFWDGSNASANGNVDGGSGTWSTAGTNWTNETGSANGGWGGSVGVFAGSAGTVTVDGTQGFDTLQFSTDGYTLTGGTLALNPASGTAGTLNIDNGVSATIGSTIADGTGSGLRKTGGGTLVLTGANSYTGGTLLLGGVLSVSADANLGAASGGLTFDGGMLATTAGMQSGRDITLRAIGGAFQTDAPLRLTGTISGDGGLTKTGAGTLTLTSANSYAGGTAVSQGRLVAAATGALGTGPVNVTTGGGLAFTDNASAGSLAVTLKAATMSFDDNASAGSATIVNTQGGINFNDIASAGDATITNDGGGTSFNGRSSAGNANITASGGGTIDFYGNTTADNATITNMADSYTRFHGDNTADAATVINRAGGAVDISGLTSGGIGIGSLSGDGKVILGSKVLTLGGLPGTSDTIGGVISGTNGSLSKIGTGTLTLNGINTYTGLTTVNGGKLIIGDDAHATASLIGGVLVNSGGTLGGIGTVGSTTIASGGTIAPGNSIGILTVDGDIAFATGSTYEVEIDPALDSDLIEASGKVTIDGGTVHAVKSGGVYTPGSRWTIIGADDGVAGTFDDFTQDMPFVDLALAYDANNVYIDATRNDVAFCDAAGTFNQCSTGDGLETAGAGNPVYDAVAALPDEDSARQALDALSGEIHASTRSALIDDSHFVRDAVNDRIRAAFGYLSTPSMPVMAYGEGGPRPASPDSFGPVAWGHAFGSWGSFDSDGNAAGMDTSTGGFLTGIDGEIAANVRLGFLAGYSHSSFDVDDRASSGDGDNYHLGLYAGGKWDALRLTGGLAYTWHDIETNRSVAFPGFTDSLSGDYNAGTFQAFGEAGYRIDAGAVSFEPFANLAYVSLHTDGFTEDGGAAALHVSGETTDATFTTLGIHLSSAFDLGGRKATAHGTLGWRHAFGDTTPISTHAFAGGGAFDIAGVPIAEDAAIIEAGFDLDLTDAATLGIAYQGQFGDGTMQNGINADLRVRF